MCSSDALGLTAVRARIRSNHQGVVFETGTTAPDLVLKNKTGTLNARLVGSLMSFGVPATP